MGGGDACSMVAASVSHLLQCWEGVGQYPQCVFVCERARVCVHTHMRVDKVYKMRACVRVHVMAYVKQVYTYMASILYSYFVKIYMKTFPNVIRPTLITFPKQHSSKSRLKV